MRTRKSAVAMMWMAAVVAPVSARPQVTVAVFDRAGLPRQVRETMQKETSQIFREAGIELAWLDCETVGAPSAECVQPLGATRLRLELVPGKYNRAPHVAGRAILQGGSCVLFPSKRIMSQVIDQAAYWAVIEV